MQGNFAPECAAEFRSPQVTPARIVNSPTLLTGLLHCDKCGAGMTLATGKGGKYRYYKCNTRIGQNIYACDTPAVPVHKLDQAVLGALTDKVLTPGRLKEMLREGWLKAEGDYTRFKAQLERVPTDKLPVDKRFNPLSMNPYVLFKALPHARRYSIEELIRAMGLLLECNQRLIFSNLDESLVLQQTLVQIIRGDNETTTAGKIRDSSKLLKIRR